MRSHRRKLILLPVVLLGLLLVFGGAEWYCRQNYPTPTPADPSGEYLQFLFENSRPFFRIERRNGEEWLVQAPTVYRTGEGLSYRRKKAAGTRRILVVGESSAGRLAQSMRNAVSDVGFAESLEVMDCSVGGGSLDQVSRRFEESVRHDPDLVILFFGSNLCFFHPDLTPWRYRFGLACRRSRLVSVLLRSPPYPKHTERVRQFVTFLHRVGSVCRRRGIRLMVCTAPSNLWAMPSYEASETSDAGYLAAMYARAEGRTDDAIRILRERDRDLPSALWQFRLAEWSASQGDHDAALRCLRKARALDLMVERADDVLNDLVRKFCLEEKAWLFDAAAFIEDKAPHATPGWESFTDYHHVFQRLFDEEARACLILLGRRAFLPPGTDLSRWAPAADPEPESWRTRVRKAVKEHRRYRGRSRDRSRFYKHAFLSHIRRGESPSPEDVLEVARDLPEKAPPDFEATLLFLWGEAYAERGDAFRASRFFRRAAELSPQGGEPLFQEGLLALRAGDRRKAASSFSRALALEGDRPDIRYFLDRANAAVGSDRPRG